MALLALLNAIREQWPCPIYPVHVDHRLRPESGEDANFVARTVPALWNWPVQTIAIDIVPHKRESMEMAARRVRYQALGEIADKLGPSSMITVAHHYEDQVETILMRILVGTGIEGLGAMRRLQGRIVRPLLSLHRSELRNYLIQHNISWREDSTNADPRWLRNRIRHRILPLLSEEVNPEVGDALIRLGQQAREMTEWVEHQADVFLAEYHIDLHAESVELPSQFVDLPRPVLIAILSRYGVIHRLRLSYAHLDQAAQKNANWPLGVRVIHRKSGIYLLAEGKDQQSQFTECTIKLLPHHGTLELAQGLLEIRPTAWPPVERATVDRWTSAVSRQRWPNIAVRCWRPGDAMRPAGMQGTKKLQDVFMDAKIPRFWRHHWPVVVSSSDEGEPVLAVVGLVVAEIAKPKVGESAHWIRWQPHTNGGWREIRS